MALRQEGFWNEHYGLELKNYEEGGDEGEVWFGKGLSRRIVNWLINRLSCPTQNGIMSSIIDVGCGNAFTLFTLVEQYKSSLKNIDSLKIIGIDYSINSIELSRRIVTGRDLCERIKLKKCDFLDLKQLNSASEGEKFDFIIDIGTFDAICLLASQSTDTLEEIKSKYMKSLYSLVKIGSIFILASCNHTEDELMPILSLQCSAVYSSKLIDRIETPKIQFAGKTGSQVTCLIFEFSEHLS